MTDTIKNDLCADFTKEDRKELIKYQISESTNQIDSCKRKQWYTVAVGIILNFGIIYVSNNSMNVLFSFNFYKLFLFLLFSILICLFGNYMIHDFLDTIEKYRIQVNYLNQFLYSQIPEDWQRVFINQKSEYDKDRRFAGMMKTILIFATIICSVILCVLLYQLIRNFLKYPGAY